MLLTDRLCHNMLQADTLFPNMLLLDRLHTLLPRFNDANGCVRITAEMLYIPDVQHIWHRTCCYTTLHVSLGILFAERKLLRGAALFSCVLVTVGC